ncbi:hypothetical protein NNL85_12980, partial [Enterococcus faecium]|nr:hypothetical protein [Enterococcus faecium]MDT6299953.1 hypothetical protein [Enterococcus faecium]MDT6316690.1 hypothetical protein [Enterococcus faecium]MDT6370292.1 hypothetical protein [Enterococcus faecium]
SLNHRYRKGFYSLFKTLQQNRSKDFFLIESEQKIIDTRNQDLNTLIKILLVKLYEVVFSDAEIV